MSGQKLSEPGEDEPVIGRPVGSGEFTDRLEVRLRDGEKDHLDDRRLKENHRLKKDSKLATLSAFVRKKLGLDP